MLKNKNLLLAIVAGLTILATPALADGGACLTADGARELLELTRESRIGTTPSDVPESECVTLPDDRRACTHRGVHLDMIAEHVAVIESVGGEVIQFILLPEAPGDPDQVLVMVYVLPPS